MKNEMKKVKDGKIRDIYDLGDKAIYVYFDKIATSNIVFSEIIPDKGKVSNKLTAFWYNYTKGCINNPMISINNADMPEEFQAKEYEGRTMLVERGIETLPVGGCVRGYATGYIWQNKLNIPEIRDLKESEKLSCPWYTPTTRGTMYRGKRINIDQSVERIGFELTRKIQEKSIELYNMCSEYAMTKGIIIADTKFKFGINKNGNLVLVDQVVTPDTSRFWLEENYKIGRPQTTYDKQLLVEELTKLGWNQHAPMPIISKEMTIDGTQKEVGVTEEFTIKDNHISHMNIGLKERKVYDMKLEKMISRVVVQNSKTTRAVEYNDSTLAKVDLDSKQLSNTSVVVEYKIRVTNEGEVAGYIRKIQDYISSDFKFSSELNKDWYQSGSNLYNSSLANIKLEPGQSKEVTLILTKQMTENNTGLVNNTAEIAESYNEQGLKDKDSTEGNRANGEDDLGSADLILSIKTGQIVETVLIILSTIVILGVAAYVITKRVLNKKVI